MDIKNKNITSRDIDFAKWYTDVVMAAKLANYSAVKGCLVIEPNGYAIWEKMQEVLDTKFKETGHKNVYMPLLIPENLMKKEGELINGFAPEVAWVTNGGQKTLEERLCIRPTSETLFSDYYSKVVNSYRDLPMKYNQWCNVMRWEKETRPFLRSREFLWQEGHTIHETREEAEEETLRMLNVYNGVCLQSATSHYFGQKFSKAYDIKFSNRENKLDYVYQTSWGSTTRMIGALIMVHSDDYGLVLPPKIAPRQVVIVPVKDDVNVNTLAEDLCNKLNDNNITTYIDYSNKSAGFKFAEAEVNGIPIRIEIGPRDLSDGFITFVRRDTREKTNVFINDDVVSNVKTLLNDIQNNLYNRALERRNEMTYVAKSMDEMKEIISNHPGFVKAMWCGNKECEDKIKEIKGTKSRCIPFEQEHISDKCVCCDKDAKEMVIWGIQY